MVDDDVWRKRLVYYSLVRFGGLAIFFLGLAIMYTNLVRQGGWPQVGAIVAIMGALDALFAPRMLKKLWDQQDAAAVDHPGDGRTDA
ncbi:MAG TPA: hypothetical protein VH392_02360 [Sphingomicrobium sp.]